MGLVFFYLLPFSVSLAAKFAEVFVHRLQNAQIFIKVESICFSSSAYVCISSVVFLPTPNLSLTTAALIAQLFQRPLHFSFLV